MAEFTLLKLQIDDVPFSSSTTSGSSSARGTADDEDSEDDSSGILPLLVGLVFLVAVAVAVKKYRDGSDEPEWPLGEPPTSESRTMESATVE